MTPPYRKEDSGKHFACRCNISLCRSSRAIILPCAAHRRTNCPPGLPALLVVAQGDVVGAALDDGDGGDQGQLGVAHQVGDVGDTDVAHGGLDLVHGGLHVVVQGTGVGDVGVNALLEVQLAGAAQIVALPVAGAVGALAPVLLHVGTADHDLVGGGLVEAGEVAAQHQEVSAHGQSQGHVVVVDDAAVGADGHIDAGLLEVLVTGCGNLDQSGSLAAADALGLTGDADGAAADADLDEVSASIGQEQEAVLVDDVTGTDLDGVAVVLADPGDGLGLPAGVALGGVDDQNVNAGVDQSGNALGVVAGVDAGADQIALLLVQQLQGVLLVGGVVLAEGQVHQVVILVHDGQAVQLVIPNDVVGFLQGGFRRSGDQLFPGSHKGRYLLGQFCSL